MCDFYVNFWYLETVLVNLEHFLQLYFIGKNQSSGVKTYILNTFMELT